MECRARLGKIYLRESGDLTKESFVVCFIYANRGLLRNNNGGGGGEGGYEIEKIKMCIDYIIKVVNICC